LIGPAHVLIYAVAPENAPAAVTTAYHSISETLAGTPGLLGNQLLRAVNEDGAFVVLSSWTSLAAFREWESGTGHRGATAPLRPYQDQRRGKPFGIYEVVASYGADT
jgi:heme oxygenase (mycobilin-producing)